MAVGLKALELYFFYWSTAIKLLLIVFTKKVTLCDILQGGQGEPGAKGERGDPGLPVCTKNNLN